MGFSALLFKNYADPFLLYPTGKGWAKYIFYFGNFGGPGKIRACALWIREQASTTVAPLPWLD